VGGKKVRGVTRCRVLLQDRVGFDFDQKVVGCQGADLDDGGHGTDVAEDFTVDGANGVEIFNVSEQTRTLA
jgi:hypothetical protein